MGINRRHSLAWSFVVMLVGLAMVVAGCGGSGGSSPSGGTGKIVMRLSSHGMVTSKVSAAMGVDASSESSILGTSGKVSLDIYNSNDNRDKLDLYSKEQQSYTVDSQGEATVVSNPVLANRSYYVIATVTPDGSSTAYTSDLWVYVEPNMANVAVPIVVPTPSPSVSPTASPSPSPTASPTPSPSVSPTVSPTPSPTASYTAAYLCPKDYSVNEDGTAVLDSTGKTIDPDSMELPTQELAPDEVYSPFVVGKTEENKYVALDSTEASLESSDTKVVSVDGLTVVATGVGSAEVQAVVGELKSNAMTFIVKKKVPQNARLSFRASNYDYVAFFYQMGQNPSAGILMDTNYDVVVEALYEGDTEYKPVSVSDFSLTPNDGSLLTVKQNGEVWNVTTGKADVGTTTFATLAYTGDDRATWTNVIEDYISTEGHIDLSLTPRPSNCPSSMEIVFHPSEEDILEETSGLSGEPTMVHSISSVNFLYTITAMGDVDGTQTEISLVCPYSYYELENLAQDEYDPIYYYAISGTPTGSFRLSIDDPVWQLVFAYYLHLEGANFDTFKFNVEDYPQATIAVYAEDATAELIAAGKRLPLSNGEATKVTAGEDFNFTVFKCVGDADNPDSYTEIDVFDEFWVTKCEVTPDDGHVSFDGEMWTVYSAESTLDDYDLNFVYQDYYMHDPAEAQVTLTISPGI